jgi:hypothetical protein
MNSEEGTYHAVAVKNGRSDRECVSEHLKPRPQLFPGLGLGSYV